jgi:dephospho-CoA kinase
MKMVGLTGGIGAGKSLVAEIFRHLGVPTFNADNEAKWISDNDPEVKGKITQWFGKTLYHSGKLDRQALAWLIFSDQSHLDKVNSLLHPKVMLRFRDWTANYHDRPYVLHEAAILFESGLHKHLDSTILVTAPKEIRIRRIISRDIVDASSIEKRLEKQWTDEQKATLANYHIINDGIHPVVPAIIQIHSILNN